MVHVGMRGSIRGGWGPHGVEVSIWGSSSAEERSHAQAHRTLDAAMAPPPEEHCLEMVPEGTSDVPWAPPAPEHSEQSLAKAF